ncbi:VIT1/CCC1 transporter family protein [Micrococcoides hystricis]|uniref:VIT family protein n=1 Tax=Micrococcoides hystricis TaxID=1572761 RepID=A0ABV6PCT6_9MICC
MTAENAANRHDAHPDEPHGEAEYAAKLNKLRAGVLGANDGIVSVAATLVGVAGATSDSGAIFIAGTAAIVGGAVSMAMGEYVSVSSSSDSQKALIAKEKHELATMPDEELEELTQLYQAEGLSRETAQLVAEELTAKDPLRAHLRMELDITEDDVASPWAAAWASAGAFLIGALIPMLAIMLLRDSVRIPGTFVATLVALALTGWSGAKLGQAPPLRPTLRTVIGGALALLVTYLVGTLIGGTGIV